MKTIPLTNSDLEAFVDDEDYELISQYKWYLHESGGNVYARMTSHQFGKNISMHRFIMGIEYKLEIDHKDGHGLNNQRGNLRYVTHANNLQGMNKKDHNSSSNFVGVSYRTSTAKWRARMWVDGFEINIGSFETEIKAAQAYDRVARNVYGDDARTNF